VPWEFGDEAVEVARRFTRLKHRLMPYLYGAAVETHRTGVPMMRPMVLEFPQDPACRPLDRQYMLGPDLLVAPVFSTDGRVEVYLPEGTWTHLLSGERVTGPRWRTERHGYDGLPLYVREGAVLPLAGDDSRPDGDWLDAPVLLAHPPAAPGYTAEVTVPDTAGLPAATFRVRREGGLLRVTATGTDRPFTVRVAGGAQAHGVGEVTLPLG